MPASTELRLICSPFHNGLKDVGMGRGASRLADDELLTEGIEAEGWTVSRADPIEPVDPSMPEVARAIELIRRLAATVAEAISEQAFPLVLAGNCNSCLGTMAGLGRRELGVVWFDAHADFDDPDENISGFFDVMALAMLTGRGWTALRQTIPGHRPVPERNVILAAARDLEPYQRSRVQASDLIAIPGPVDPEQFDKALTHVATRVDGVYVHIDLDSLDETEARANQYAAKGGPTLDRLSRCIRETGTHFHINGAAITAYDPAFDDDGRALKAARRIARDIAAALPRR